MDVPEMKQLMEHIERSTPGPEFTQQVRNVLQPVSHHMPTKDVQGIMTTYPQFPLDRILSKFTEEEMAQYWQAIGMTNMLLNTMSMLPPEMLSKVETLTSTMMNAMQGNSGNGLAEMFQSMMNPGGDDDDDDPPEEVPRPKKKKKYKDKQSEFRDKLC